MVKKEVFEASGGELVVGSGDWCEISVRIIGGGEILLGAENRRVVVERIKKMVVTAELEGKEGVIGGVRVKWIMSFSERHGSIYAGDAKDGRHVFAQDEEGKVVAELVLDKAERDAWLRKIQEESEGGMMRADNEDDRTV